MDTQYNTWLNSLAQQVKGPLILPAATRKLAYTHNLFLSGEWDATIQAQVRAAPDSGTILAQFTIGTRSYVGGNTLFPISLAAGDGANSTGALPADTDMDGVEYFPFDILMTLGGVTDRLVGGILPVSGHVTLGA